jgi:TolB protein
MNVLLLTVGLLILLVVEMTLVPIAAADSATSEPASTPGSLSGDSSQGKLVFQEASGGNIYMINADGTDLQLLTRGMDPSLSLDGKQLAFARWDKEKGIYRMDMDDGESRLIHHRQHPRWPTLSPDGRRIVYGDSYLKRRPAMAFNVPGPYTVVIGIPGEVGYWSLQILDLWDNSVIDQRGDWRSYSPSWSPDGKTMVFAGVGGLKLVEDDGEPWSLTEGYWDSSPSWSPDGSRIAYMYKQHDHWEIYTIRPDGSDWRRLTKEPLLSDHRPNNVAPAWSPDGQHITFLSDRNGEWELFLMNADGSGQRKMFETELDGIQFHYEFASERVVSWAR